MQYVLDIKLHIINLI